MSLIRMSHSELEALLSSDDDCFETVQALIWNNASLPVHKSWERIEGAATLGQRVIYLFDQFTAEVNNAGVSQFIFNCPELLKPLLEALPMFDLPELTARLDEVIGGITLAAIEDMREARAGADILEAYANWATEVDDLAFNLWFFSRDAKLARAAKIKELISRSPHDFITG